jgi:hypothetical protein
MSGYEVIKGKNKYDHYKIDVPTEEVGIVYGHYEVWDRDSGGVVFYEEGQLVFEDGELIDYDGMVELPESIINEIANIRKVSL